jgi:hypothetical protein
LTGAGLALSGVCARVPILISLHDPGLATGVGDMMVMGVPR